MAGFEFRFYEDDEKPSIRFDNAKQLSDFFQNELKFLKNLNLNSDSPGIESDVQSAIRYLQSASSNLLSYQNAENLETGSNAARSFFRSKWPHTDTPERRLLDSLIEKNAEHWNGLIKATFELLYGNNQPQRYGTPRERAIASFAVSAMEFGLDPLGNPLYRVDAKLQKSYNQRILSQLEHDVSIVAAEIEDEQRNLENKTNYLVLMAKKRFSVFRRVRKKSVQSTKDEIEKLHKTYREQMRLQEPVKYWTDKAKMHALGAKIWLFATIVSALLVIILPFIAWMFLSQAYIGIGVSLENRQVGINLDWPTLIREVKTLALVLITSGLTVWALRFSARVYLSERHLITDARERETIVMTYLALLKENAATDAERAIVLQTLFRSTADGIVKDDSGMDPALSGLLGKVIEKLK